MKSFTLALVLVLGLALAGCGSNASHKMYSATAEIEIRFREGPEHPGANDPSGPAQIASEIELMQSNDVFVPVIDNHKLNQTWGKRFKSGESTLTWQEALDHMHKILKIEAVPKTNIIKITASSEVPQEAATIANAVVDNYKVQRDKQEAGRNKRNMDALGTQIAQQQKVVEAQRAAANKQPQAVDPRRALMQQTILDALNSRLKQVTADQQSEESPVRIVSRAVAPE